jgi:hypothetical protein
LLLTTIQDNQTIIIISIADDDRNLEEVRKKIKFTPDYKASEPVFWRVFKELANERIMD